MEKEGRADGLERGVELVPWMQGGREEAGEAEMMAAATVMVMETVEVRVMEAADRACGCGGGHESVAVVMAEVEWRAEVSVARTGLDSEVVDSWVRVVAILTTWGAAEAVLPRAFSFATRSAHHRDLEVESV